MDTWQTLQLIGVYGTVLKIASGIALFFYLLWFYPRVFPKKKQNKRSTNKKTKQTGRGKR
jgi:hypothetical protein